MVDPCKAWHGHLCRSGALQTRVPGDDRSDKAADNKS